MSAQATEATAGDGRFAPQPLRTRRSGGQVGGGASSTSATSVASGPRRPSQHVATLPTLVDVDTLATHLNVTVHHVRRLVQEKRIPHIKIGTYVRFDPERVAEWLAGECTIEPYAGPRHAPDR